MEKCLLLFTAKTNKYLDSTVQRAEDRRQKFHFCRLPFAVNVMLNLSNDVQAFYAMASNLLCLRLNSSSPTNKKDPLIRDLRLR